MHFENTSYKCLKQLQMSTVLQLLHAPLSLIRQLLYQSKQICILQFTLCEHVFPYYRFKFQKSKICILLFALCQSFPSRIFFISATLKSHKTLQSDRF